MLGLLLKDVRMIKDIRPKKLIEGTSCTANMLKKYENGMTQFEKLLGDALWQRTGKSTEKLQVFLEQDEYGLGSKRAYIQNSIRKGELTEAEEALNAYEKLEETDRVQHLQFICLQHAELYRRREEPYEKQMSMVRKGLAYSIYTPLSPEILKTKRFGMLELLLLERYAFLLEQESVEEAVRWYEEFKVYLAATEENGVEMDHADQYRLLPPILYHHAVWAVQAGFFKRALGMLNEGLRMLGERHAFLALFVRMEELKLEILPKLKEEVPAWEAGCLALLRELMQKCNPAWEQNIYPDYAELSLYCVNDALRERLPLHGKTVKDIAGGIGIRTVRAIESGEQMPQAATKNALFGELGLSTCKYGGSVVTRRFSDYMEMAKMIKYDYNKAHGRAEEIYEKLVKGLDKDEVINAQFIKYWDIKLRYGKGEMKEEQFWKELWKMLEETLPKYRDVKMDCVLTEYEQEIVTDIGWTIDVENENAVYIEEILKAQYEKFCKDGALVCFFPGYYTVLAYCLGRIARRKKEYERAECILNQVLGQCYFLQDDLYLGKLFVQRFQLNKDIQENVQKTQGLPPAQDDEYFQDLRYAYAIEKLYLRDSRSTNFIEKYLDKNYGGKDMLQDLF